MMKRRFTTILAGVLAGNTAFFATQAIATQEMQPTAQVADQYMIIDLENIPLAQAPFLWRKLGRFLGPAVERVRCRKNSNNGRKDCFKRAYSEH